MAIRLITYDLRKPGQDYKDFLKTVKEYSWARLSESSYAVDTSETPKTIYEKLRPYMDENDYLMVMTLTTPYMGYNLQTVIDWLTKHLPQ